MAAKRKQITKPSAPQTQAAKPTAATTIKPASGIKPTSRFAKPKLISSKLTYKGKVFSVFTDKVEEPSGFVHTRDVIRHNGSVVILAVDESKNPSDPEIILIRQFRHAAGQFLIELPAGRVDANEATLAAAKREMIEETGYRAKRWTLLTKYFASPGFLGEWMQIYLARDLRQGASAPEPDENIEVFRLPLSEALALIAANKIHDGKTLIGLMLYDSARRAGRL
ncbi:NUDIX hydrolase [Tunturibacter empetritectus]|uniref:GDP-mannose pyrophosphatase n=1 Tax=Tunturiibacter empetritectus TaxID=3069691 RepID=A0A7W8MRP2_9BACT|nr:NUDIX hydrolase [Edaphobacter lichenicola]MBB5317848.1 ADP-ribose pyrophosphatase [Edaphobacter lichenicola]